MPNTPPITPLPKIPLERHRRPERISTFWKIAGLLSALNAVMLIEKCSCDKKNEASVVRTPDAIQKEEQRARKKKALELSKQCYMDLLLDTRKECRNVTETDIRKRAWECEKLRSEK